MKRLSNAEFDKVYAHASQLTEPSAAQVEVQPLFFDGQIIDSPLADWARLRTNEFGETVKPEHVYVASKDGHPHVVAWLYRNGIDFDSGEPYSFFHLACDCAPESMLRE